MSGDAAELSRRAALATGQIVEALGSLATLLRFPEACHAESALRRALAELDGTTEPGRS